MLDIHTCVQLISSDPQTANHARDALCNAGISCQLVNSPRDCQHAPACRWLQPLTNELQTRLILNDAINTLEKTRHAFKSRDLADLRRRLQALMETL
ncbi:hypothetical protein [Pseudomonas sp. TMP25]|uniref:hypothetical protein n=1 Tax=Pseudomonas sp. TMP25 TaxID=3136561 RepID=UPI0031011D92